MAQDWRSFGLLALFTLGLRAAGQAAHAAFVKDARQRPIQVDASVFGGQVVQILAWAELNPLPRLFVFTPASRCCRQPWQFAHPMDYGPSPNSSPARPSGALPALRYRSGSSGFTLSALSRTELWLRDNNGNEFKAAL